MIILVKLVKDRRLAFRYGHLRMAVPHAASYFLLVMYLPAFVFA
jgi:hypothetical protein